MRGAQTMPAWLQRRRSRRLDCHHDDRVVRWIARQTDKDSAAPGSVRRPDDWSNDNVVPIKEWIAV